VTYLTSAFWQGFYPGYYMTFLTGAMYTVVETKLRRRLRPYLDPSAPSAWWKEVLRRVGLPLFLQIMLIYVTMPFVLLRWQEAWTFWLSSYFYGHIVMVLLFFVT
jgi:lysophospholipid acyltransferase